MRRWVLLTVLALSVLAVVARAEGSRFDLTRVLHHPGAEYLVFVGPVEEGSEALKLFAVAPALGTVTEYDLPEAKGWPFIVDGREFLYSQGGDIWALDLSNATKRKVATGPFVLVDILPEVNGTRIAVGYDAKNDRCIAELSSAPPKVLLSILGGSGWPGFLHRYGDSIILGWIEDRSEQLGFLSLDLAKKSLGERRCRMEYDDLSIGAAEATFRCGDRLFSIPFQTYLLEAAYYQGTLYICTATYAWVSLSGGESIRLDSSDIVTKKGRIVLSSAGVCLLDRSGTVTLKRAEGEEPVIRIPLSQPAIPKGTSVSMGTR